MVSARRFTLGELAESLGATLDGEAGRVITGVAALESAGPQDISFVIAPRYAAAALASRAGAFLAAESSTGLPAPTLRARDPRRALVDLLRLFHPAAPAAPGCHPTVQLGPGASVEPSASVGAYAVLEAGARIGARTRLGAFVFVGAGASVGEDCVVGPRVTLGEGVRLGRRVIIHPGAVIGADGFGYVFDGAAHVKMPQVGGVVLEDDVEVGANTTIDRATLGDTVVRRGSKLDNLVQVAHNVEIGEHCIVAAQSGVAGSSRLGRHVVLAGQVGIADHVTVADDALLAAQAGVAADIAEPGLHMGTPARPARIMRRIWVAREQLPDLPRRLRAIERRLREVETRLGAPGDAPRG